MSKTKSKVQRTISGRNIQGDERTYTFDLMNAKEGTRIFHEYVSVIVQLLPDGASLSNLGDGLELDIKQLIADLEVMLPFEKLEKLAASLLGGGSVEIDGKLFDIDPDGFGEYALGDPIEVYTAILYAFKANYPKYIDPLFESLEANQGDPDSDTQTPTKKAQK